MANVTFNDLPTRTSVLDTDKFIIYRSGEKTFPESGLNWSTIKNNVLNGLIVRNNFYQKSSSLNISTNKQIIEIKAAQNALITHKSISNTLFCFAQIKCQKQAPTSAAVTNLLKNTLCNYQLKWIGKNQTPTTLVAGYLPINYYAGATDVTSGIFDISLPQGRECIMIPPFNPKAASGYFEVTINFTNNISTAGVKALVEANIWAIESDPNN
jgi:hypothetical protein